MKYLYSFTIKYEAEDCRRDEFGWVDGHEPGNGRYKEYTETQNVLSSNEDLAEIAVLRRYSGYRCRNAVIIDKTVYPIHMEVDVKYLS